MPKVSKGLQRREELISKIENNATREVGKQMTRWWIKIEQLDRYHNWWNFIQRFTYICKNGWDI